MMSKSKYIDSEEYVDNLNTQLYEKVFEEQRKFREYLLNSDPKNVLDHAYEYSTREDILLSFEYNSLNPEACNALLRVDNLLSEIYDRWINTDTDYMLDIWITVEREAGYREKKREEEEEGEF